MENYNFHPCIHLDVFAVLLDCGVLSTVGWRHRCTDTVSGWQTAAVNHLYSPPPHHPADRHSPVLYTHTQRSITVSVLHQQFTQSWSNKSCCCFQFTSAPDSYSGSFRFDCNPSRDEESVQLCLSPRPLVVITGWCIVYWLFNVTVLYSWQYRILIL